MTHLESYENIQEVVRPGGLITFTEYKLDRHQRRKPTAHVEGAPVEAVIGEGESLSRDQIDTYYGEVSDQDARVLSSTPYTRIVIQVKDAYDRPVLTVLNLAKLFMDSGLQIVEYDPATIPSMFTPSPANVLAEPPLKGFSDYQVGAGLFRNLPK